MRVAVLDEADRLLDLGFEDQIRLLLTRRMPRTGEGGARGGRSALVVSWGSFSRNGGKKVGHMGYNDNHGGKMVI